MFNNIPEMYAYLDKLKNIVEEHLNKKKEELNFKCEACNKNSIEVDFKPGNFTEEYYNPQTGKTSLVINCNFFCRSCYKKLLDSGQIDKSIWMENVDKEIFEEV